MVLYTIMLLFLVTNFLAIVAGKDEFPMENTDAYQTAFKVNPCLTSCAVQPSKTFVAEHGCPLDDPSECICANVTASIELRDSMTAYCFSHCDATVGPLVTPILKQYCERNPVQTQGPNITTDLPQSFTPNGPSKSYTTFMTTTTSVTPTTTSTPPPGGAKDSTLGLGLGIGIPAVVIALLTLLFMMYIRWKPDSAVAVRFRELRNRGQPEEGLGADDIDLAPVPAPAPRQ